VKLRDGGWIDGVICWVTQHAVAGVGSTSVSVES